MHNYLSKKVLDKRAPMDKLLKSKLLNNMPSKQQRLRDKLFKKKLLKNQALNGKLANSKQVSKLKKGSSFDYFYWKYIYGDFVISKFINFLVKSGHKNRAIKLFFKALFNLKNKFGVNPILLIKYIILKRNVLHKVTKKKVKQKTFYYLRLLDFDKQISNTIKKIMELILFLKQKKQIKLWQSIFLILLNFSVLKNKKKKINSLKYDAVNFNLNAAKVIKGFSLLRLFSSVRKKYLRLYVALKSNIFLLSRIFIFIFRFKKYLKVYLKRCKKNLDISSLEDILSILAWNKNLYYYLTVIKYRLARLNHKYSSKLEKYRNKIRRFFYSFKRLKNKYLLNRIDSFRTKQYKKRMLHRNKALLRSKYKQHFLTRFFFKDLSELKKASKFKNSFLNFKLKNKKKKELAMGTRIHGKHDIRLRHRKIFFRVSKHGQVKN
jgi:hypothetical protein